MNISQYVHVLSRRKWVILLVTLTAAAAALAGTLIQEPVYRATATLRLLTAMGGSLDYASYDSRYADRVMNTYVALATSQPILEELEDRMGPMSGAAYQIEVRPVPDTELMQVSVESTRAGDARDVANGLAEILVAHSEQLYAGGEGATYEILSQELARAEEELSQAQQEYRDAAARVPSNPDEIAIAERTLDLRQQAYEDLLDMYIRTRLRDTLRVNALSIADAATLPEAPVRPRPLVSLGLGLALGLVGGAGLGLVLENADSRLHSTKQIEEVTDLSILGQIPRIRGRSGIAFTRGNAIQAEAFRSLCGSLFALDHSRPINTVLITSPEPREGKTTTIVNLAIALTQCGRRVIAVDADLRQPRLHQALGLPNGVGLTNVLRGEMSLDRAIQVSQTNGVVALTSGPLLDHPAALLSSQRVQEILRQLAEVFDVVLVDSSASLPVTDVNLLATKVSAVLLVVERSRSKRESVEASLQQLKELNVQPVGVIVNRAARDGQYNYYCRPPTQQAK